MKRAGVLLLIAVIGLAIVVWIERRSRNPSNSARVSTTPGSNVMISENSSGSMGATNTAPILGETILRDYANTNLPPQNDLTLMSRLMENSILLLKSAANRPLSANEDWADFLRGQNAAHERFLPDSHAAFDSQGRLVDRWKSPLFFHAVGGGRFEIRSAGPDRKLWTEDDIHRNSDGSFRRGNQLNPPTLFNATPKTQ